jgi:hypothetical protein
VSEDSFEYGVELSPAQNWVGRIASIDYPRSSSNRGNWAERDTITQVAQDAYASRDNPATILSQRLGTNTPISAAVGLAIEPLQGQKPKSQLTAESSVFGKAHDKSMSCRGTFKSFEGN